MPLCSRVDSLTGLETHFGVEMYKTAVFAVLAFALCGLARPMPIKITTCSFVSYNTNRYVELLENGVVAASGAGTGEYEEVEFVLTHLPDRHINIMRQGTSTFLVYNNGKFTHDDQPSTDNHVFLVEYEFGGQAISLKAVNHKYEEEVLDFGSGSGVAPEEDASEVMLVEEDCYLGFSEDGKPFCHSSKLTESGDPKLDILFFSPCFN